MIYLSKKIDRKERVDSTSLENLNLKSGIDEFRIKVNILILINALILIAEEDEIEKEYADNFDDLLDDLLADDFEDGEAENYKTALVMLLMDKVDSDLLDDFLNGKGDEFYSALEILGDIIDDSDLIEMVYAADFPFIDATEMENFKGTRGECQRHIKEKNAEGYNLKCRAIYTTAIDGTPKVGAETYSPSWASEKKGYKPKSSNTKKRSKDQKKKWHNAMELRWAKQKREKRKENTKDV